MQLVRSKLSRRAMLRGAGVALGLPWLDAAAGGAQPTADAASFAGRPVRVGYIYWHGGFHSPAWTPRTGRLDALPASLQRLANVRQHATVVSNVTLDRGVEQTNLSRPAAFMHFTASTQSCNASPQFYATADQVAAEKFGRGMPLRSLELATGLPVVATHCPRDRGPLDHMSWESPTKPRPGESSPRRVFEQLFGVAPKSHRLGSNKSVLDAVESRRRFTKELGIADRQRLETYFTTIRQLEKQIDTVERELRRCPTLEILPTSDAAREHEATRLAQAQVLLDLMALAYQGNMTRVATLQLSTVGSMATGDKLAERDREIVTLFAEFIEKLKATPVGNATLLDETCVLLGSSEGDPEGKQPAALPLIIAGGGLGNGRHHVAAPGTTLPHVHRAIQAKTSAT